MAARIRPSALRPEPLAGQRRVLRPRPPHSRGQVSNFRFVLSNDDICLSISNNARNSLSAEIVKEIYINMTNMVIILMHSTLGVKRGQQL